MNVCINIKQSELMTKGGHGMQWLIENKEWVFSGIGLPICAWIIKLFIQKKKATSNSVITQSQTSEIILLIFKVEKI